jgi:hypothetical protein
MAPRRKTVPLGTRIDGWEVAAIDTTQGDTQAEIQCLKCGHQRRIRLTQAFSSPPNCEGCANIARHVQLMDTQTGTVYKSISAMAEAFGVSYSCAYAWIEGRGRNGGRFERLEPEDEPEEPAPPPPARQLLEQAFDGKELMPLPELQILAGEEVVSRAFDADYLAIERRGVVRLLG